MLPTLTPLWIHIQKVSLVSAEVSESYTNLVNPRS